MAKNAKALGNGAAWGIVEVATKELVDVSLGRMAIRESKRNLFAGNGFKVVQLVGKLVPYSK